MKNTVTPIAVVRLRLLFFSIFIIPVIAFGQQSGSFVVNGSLTNFYPVLFNDGDWAYNVATRLELGRSNVHEDELWLGSLIADFSFHVTRWGHGAAFINADIVAGNGNPEFIAGLIDATAENGDQKIIIWLRGGGATYHFKSDYTADPLVYDDVQHSLPYNEENGPLHTCKMALESYVNSNGVSCQGTTYYNGSGTNFFAGNIGVGVQDTKGYKLAVDGAAVFKKVVVKNNSALPDYVFDSFYQLWPLANVEEYIRANKYLTGIPAAGVIAQKGDIADNQSLLLKKVEELTLYLIEQNKKLADQEIILKAQEQQIMEMQLLLKKK